MLKYARTSSHLISMQIIALKIPHKFNTLTMILVYVLLQLQRLYFQEKAERVESEV